MSMNTLVGVPFQWGGRGPESFDCWGLALAGMEELGIRISRDWPFDENDWAAVTETIRNETDGDLWWRVVPPGNPAVGDVAVLDHHHVGLFVEQGSILHTSRATGSVIQRIPMVLARYRKIRAYRWAG